MKLIYPNAPVEVGLSIFLAGPTPREASIPSWRVDAIENLEARGFDGIVFVPEPSLIGKPWDWEKQVAWEWSALNEASAILFWIPREREHMPAFTTNVEFGMWIGSGKTVLGYPSSAVKMRYLRWHMDRVRGVVSHTLAETVQAAIERAALVHELMQK